MGFVGCNLNPDPSGGYWTGKPMTDREWYPLYEALCDLDVPAMIHVAASCNPCYHGTGAHYLNADTSVFMQLLQGNVFKDFPTLRLVIPHGGGAVPYHWGRYRGMSLEMMDRPLEGLLDNIFFDTCVYHQPGVELLTKVVPTSNVLFGSEMIGAVRGRDPNTGEYFDDTKRYIDACSALSDADRHADLRGQCAPRLSAPGRAPEGQGTVTQPRAERTVHELSSTFILTSSRTTRNAIRQRRCSASARTGRRSARIPLRR